MDRAAWGGYYKNCQAAGLELLACFPFGVSWVVETGGSNTTFEVTFAL